MKFFDWRPRKKVSILAQIGPTWPKYDPENVYLGLWPKQPLYTCSFWRHKNFGPQDHLWGGSGHPLSKSMRPKIRCWALKMSNVFSIFNQALRGAKSQYERFLVYLSYWVSYSHFKIRLNQPFEPPKTKNGPSHPNGPTQDQT